MRDGDDPDLMRLHLVDDAIREPIRQAFAGRRRQLRPRIGEVKDALNRGLHDHSS